MLRPFKRTADTALKNAARLPIVFDYKHTGCGQWLIKQGVDLVRAVSGGAVTIDAAPVTENGEDYF